MRSHGSVNKPSMTTDHQWIQLPAQLVHGYGVASGQALDSPYPQGSIALQLPYFLALGLDLRGYYLGTLNLSITPYHLQLISPKWTFPDVEWLPGCRETFSFSPCQIVLGQVTVDALIYHPHPETKPAHFQSPSIVEVLAPYLKDLESQRKLDLKVRKQEISVQTN